MGFTPGGLPGQDGAAAPTAAPTNVQGPGFAKQEAFKNQEEARQRKAAEAAKLKAAREAEPERQSLLSQGPDGQPGLLQGPFKLDQASQFGDVLKNRLSQAQDSATQRASQGAGIARRTLASRGGIDSGARERIAQQQSRDVQSGLQDATRQDLEGQAKLAGIRGKEAQFNIEQALSEKGKQDQFELEKFKERQKRLSAERSAQAEEKAAEEAGKK